VIRLGLGRILSFAYVRSVSRGLNFDGIRFYVFSLLNFSKVFRGYNFHFIIGESFITTIDDRFISFLSYRIFIKKPECWKKIRRKCS